MEIKNVITRAYESGDEEGINELFYNLFGQRRSLANWYWKFIENPAFGDPSLTTVVATQSDKIVAQYVYWGMKMKYGNQVIRVAQSVDTMIASSERNRLQLLHDCFRESFELIKPYFVLAFGFPNETAYKVGKMILGYKDYGEMIQLFKRLSLRSAIERRWKRMPRWLIKIVQFASGTAIRCSLPRTKQSVRELKVNQFDTRIDNFADKFSDRYGIITIRNASYLNWRYGSAEYLKMVFEKNGEIVGYGIVKIDKAESEKRAYLLDYAYIDDKINTLSQILSKLIQMDVDYVLFALKRDDPMIDHVKRFGFFERPEFKPYPIVYMKIQDGFDDSPIEKDKYCWHLTYGDSDGY